MNFISKGMVGLPMFFLLLLYIQLNTTHLIQAGKVPTYTLNLDLPPNQRYNKFVHLYNETVWLFYDRFFAHDPILTDILYDITKERGLENEEQQGEIEGMATASGLPLPFVQGIQMLYELQTLMVPIVNFTHHNKSYYGRDYIPLKYKALRDVLPWNGGCTGIIARNANDGTVYHARNLDFMPYQIMHDLVYDAKFVKGGKILFESQMIAGYTMPITAIKRGLHGYAIERNTRYTDHWGGNKEMFNNLKSGRNLNGWTLRKILETATTFDDAVKAISIAPFVSTEYAIISGVQKGVILAKNPDNVAYKQVLGERNFDEPNDYIIMTNFDFFYNDIREGFDPTGHGGFGKPSRRIAAQRLLNASKILTPEVLYSVLNAKYVIADTVFQAIINVEKDLWNISQPSGINQPLKPGACCLFGSTCYKCEYGSEHVWPNTCASSRRCSYKKKH
jgi:hypothetical protein